MTKTVYRVLEILCVALLIGFIVFLFISSSGGTKKSVKELSVPVLKVTDTKAMSKKTAADAAKVFGFDTQKAEGILYYANDNIMDVSELLIVKLNDENDAASFKAAVEQHVTNQENLFKNYAPDQYSLLKNSITEVSGNTLFYCTSLDADAIYEAFQAAL